MCRRSVIKGTIKWRGATYCHEELAFMEGDEVLIAECPHAKNAINIYSKGLALLCIAKMVRPKSKRIIQLPLFTTPPQK